MTEARAYWVTAPGQGELRSEALPALGSDSVRVRTQFSAVSRGTESLVFHGVVPESEWQRMRAPHQAGDFPAPVKYGYSSVGVVVEGEAALRDKTVFCLYPHQDQYVVPARSVVVVPDGVTAARAVLAANLETALNACWDARPLLGDRISVIGGGVVGALVTFLVAGVPGVEVELVDTNPERARVARAFGAQFALPAAARGERDLVFHASATEAGLSTALAVAAKEASVVELSWYGDRPVTLALGGAFHVRRLKLLGSQVGSVSPRARPRYSYHERLSLALDLCRSAALDVLFEADVPFAELPATMNRIMAPGASTLCQRVRYA
ncbi:MAG TPA: zinc-binding alcohol dehydrogenase [Polyangiaceae bacterium]